MFSLWVVSTGIIISPTLKANGGTANFSSIAVEEIGVPRHSRKLTTARKYLFYILEQVLVRFCHRKIKREIC